MDSFSPLVSIIIPVYNGSNYMREAIDSALSQTYRNVEVIVVNDGSTDDTDAIALSYGDRIRYFKKENGGVSSALNLGIKEMRGDYFSWLSHDDKYDSHKIESQIELLANTTKKTIAYCDSAQINRNSETIRKSTKNRFLSEGLNDSQKSLAALIKSGCFGGCALLVPKCAFLESGLFDEKLRFAQDFLMWIRILLKGYSIVYKREENVLSRIHSAQLTQTGNDVFHRDAFSLSRMLLSDLADASTKKYNYVFFMAKCFAKYNCNDAVDYILKNGKLSFFKKISVRITKMYGGVRPFLRKAYYTFFRKL